MNRSNVTSFSFTVQDDLISETSANTTFIKPRPFNNKPFTKDYGIKGAAGINYEQPVPTLQKKIVQQAHNEAFRQMNNQLYNPFQHKLQNGYIKKQFDLYQRQKQKQIELIKKKEMQQLNNSKNYIILFNNNNPNPPGRSLKVAANNILAQENNVPVPTIGDYYNQKFKKNKPLDNIQEEQEEIIKKKDNFVADRSVKKIDKPLNGNNIKESNNKPRTIETEKIIKSKSGWKRQSSSQQQININQVKKSQENIKMPYTPPIHVPKPHKKEQIPPRQIIKPQIKKQNIPKHINKNQVNKPVMKANQDGKKLLKLPNGKKKYSEVYEGADRNLVQQLEQQISECPNITFDDIAELQNAKGLLQEAVLLPRMMPQFFKGIRKAMKGILLFGPPGTGKTLLAKAVASNNMFFNVSASSLASKWKGDSQKMVRLLFEIARYHSPSVIFFDEIDSIATKRSENQHESTRKVKTQLLVQMDGVGNSDQSVFVLAATNRPWDLDQALRRRLQKRIYIPLPGNEGRRKMFDINLKDLKLGSSINWQKLIQLTKGCSGADICNICRDAAYMPMRKKLLQVGGIGKISQLSQKDLLNEQITQNDLIQAAKKIKPSVGNDDLKRYSQWMKQFGSS